MSKNEEFSQGRTPECPEASCNRPAGDHIHLDRSDIDAMEAFSQAGRLHGQIDAHMRTAPTDMRDHAALKAHMLSSGHYAHPLDVHEMSHERLKQFHDEDHANMDAGPADERENYTDFGHEHMHNE
jgi:hypothetical protein